MTERSGAGSSSDGPDGAEVRAPQAGLTITRSDEIAAVDHEVLSTLEADGTRRWMNPRPSSGRFQRARAVVAYALIALFAAIPWLSVNGKPLLLLDLQRRVFTFGGFVLYATDTLVLTLFLLGMFALVFFLTAVFGRVWCGWGCPQTVYMEFVFRPLERLLLGRAARRSDSVPLRRRAALWLAYLVLALLMAHTFLGYFVPVTELWQWVRTPPSEHLASFLVVMAVTALVFFDFVAFREQMCTLVCPYGRLQSVLLDKRSLVVGYDSARGEPRGKARDGAAGDCVDCKACVATCPTGIDIRSGLQMECIACTQCIDACDAIMGKLGRAPGLIRYATQEELAPAKDVVAAGPACGPKMNVSRARPAWRSVRSLVYVVLTVSAFTALFFVARSKTGLEVTVLRDRVAPFQVLDGGLVSNQLHLKLQNRGSEAGVFDVTIPNLSGVRIAGPDLPRRVEAGKTETVNLVVMAPLGELRGGRRNVDLVISDTAGARVTVTTRLVGPEDPR